MRRVRSRLTILLLILVIVTSLFSLTFGALVRNGIIFQQRDNIRYLVFGYAAKDILLLLIAVAAVAALITVTSRSTTNPIRELSRAAREIAGGNYDVTVPERDRVEEFGELERNFNLMTAELRSNEYLRKDFISSVSHQLKTPLSILNGYAQLLAEGGLSETEEREYSQYIAQESDRLCASRASTTGRSIERRRSSRSASSSGAPYCSSSRAGRRPGSPSPQTFRISTTSATASFSIRYG